MLVGLQHEVRHGDRAAAEELVAVLWGDERSRTAIAALGNAPEQLTSAEVLNIRTKLDQVRAAVPPKSGDFMLRLPTSREGLVEKFLSVAEGPQRLLLAAMKLAAERQGDKQMGELVTLLREDPRTRERVAHLENTVFVKQPKSKARRGR